MSFRIFGLICACIILGFFSYRWGSRRVAAKNEETQKARKEVARKDTKAADVIAKRYVLQAIRRLEKDTTAIAPHGSGAKTGEHERDSALARETAKVANYPTLVSVVPKLSNSSGSVYPDWLIKVQCQGLGTNPMMNFSAVFRYQVANKPTVAAKLRGGMRLRLQVEPFDAQPQDLRQLPMVDDSQDFTLPVYWVTSFDHDEPSLSALSVSPIVEIFGQMPAHHVFKAPIETQVGNSKAAFNFYGGNWANYRQDAAVHLLVDQPGYVRHSVTSLHRALKERGIRLIFAPVPLSAAVFSDMATGKDEGESLEGSLANGAVADLLSALRQGGVEVLDLTKTLRRQRYVNHQGEKYPVYQPNGLSLAAPGCMVIASELAKIVKASTNYPADHGTTSSLFRIESSVVQHPGDLQEVPILKSLGIRLPMLPMLLPHVVPQTEAARFMLSPDANQTAVQLIGDTQCEIFRDDSASIHVHLVRELGQSANLVSKPDGAHNSAVNEWLSSDNLATAKIVFWLVSEPYLGTPDWIDCSNHPALLTQPATGSRK